ncbi:MAG TPA: UDP-N-acetylglucosamine 2-epimerase (non-hydrolyzing) [Bacteroidales bacterium]|nr:UDP-N-acetylglucosamine 2-epimerase (non-hydrolyzing) [Bacteroidales bacterium]HPI86730.1 UDP-N-acetylglucosamine 2-epimerase (non-hydrolyzing) [Bacteroidales bacterium]HPM93476.1 UDP-N-acetylglucosamine 2-epimerase (non-hydrolyzing) [Bacteroidales bacterium]
MKRFRIISIVGARPQFIKVAAICRAAREHFAERIEHLIIHTGQHYDENMSKVFFDEMEIPEPDFNLETGSGSHGFQTAGIMLRTEKVLEQEKPDIVIVYGDTNSTLAGALAAAKMHIPVAHIEAGLRSFNKLMPEEINRVVADHVATLLFTPTKAGQENLAREGFAEAVPPYSADNPAVFHCGDVMYDNALYYSSAAEKKTEMLDRLDLHDIPFILLTIHRENNTDSADRLERILGTLNELSREYGITCVFPMHPRTRKMTAGRQFQKLMSEIGANLLFKVTGPLSYFETLLLEKNCQMVITDSGGVQKESFFFRKPCLVLRDGSEWSELVELGTARLVDDDTAKIRASFAHFLKNPPTHFPGIYGDGRSAEFILGELVKFLTGGLHE